MKGEVSFSAELLLAQQQELNCANPPSLQTAQPSQRLNLSQMCHRCPLSDEEEQCTSEEEQPQAAPPRLNIFQRARELQSSCSDEEDQGTSEGEQPQAAQPLPRLNIFQRFRELHPSCSDEEEQDTSEGEQSLNEARFEHFNSNDEEQGTPEQPTRTIVHDLQSHFEDADSTQDSENCNLAQPRRGRPITNNSKMNADARRQYLCRKNARRVNTPRLPDSIRRRAQRVNYKQIKEAQKSLSTGQTDEGFMTALPTLHTTAGRKAFPAFAAVVCRQNVHTAVGASVCKALSMGTVGNAHTVGVVQLCLDTENLTDADMRTFCDLAGLSLKYVQRVQRFPSNPQRLFTENYTQRKPTDMCDVEKTPQEKLVIRFFNEHSSVRSGAKRQTREVGLGHTELQIEFYAEYCKRLRILNTEDPSVLTRVLVLVERKMPITRFQSSLAFAVACARQAGFNPLAEETARRLKAKQVYNYHLEELRLRNLQITMHFASAEERHTTSDNEMKLALQLVLPPAESLTELDPCEETQLLPIAPSAQTKETEISALYPLFDPPCKKSFWKVIKKFKIHWTQHFKPTECPIHDSGPLHVEKLKTLNNEQHISQERLLSARNLIVHGRESNADVRQSRIDENRELEALKKLEQAVRKLRDHVKLFELHVKQYEACRKTIKNFEANLKVGEGVMYRDFVAAYNCDGEKIQNLVLVFLWRSVDKGPLRVFKFNNLCGDEQTRSADAHFVAGLALLTLMPSLIFANVNP